VVVAKGGDVSVEATVDVGSFVTPEGFDVQKVINTMNRSKPAVLAIFWRS
jgi:hypothetical protein